MIASLKGLLESKTESACVVDVQGVGYEVWLPTSAMDLLPPLGEPITLHTWYLGREDGVQLYGFLKASDRALFRLLLGVSGVGPKSALAVLSGLSQAQLETVVARQDAEALSRLPGIGRKTAERLLLELKSKLKTPAGGLPPVEKDREEYGEALEALLALGYSALQARLALQKIQGQDLPEGQPGLRVAEIVRRALKHL